MIKKVDAGYFIFFVNTEDFRVVKLPPCYKKKMLLEREELITDIYSQLEKLCTEGERKTRVRLKDKNEIKKSSLSDRMREFIKVYLYIVPSMEHWSRIRLVWI